MKQQNLPLAINQYSSTQFRYKDKHCPKAMRLHREGVEENTDVFQVGIAAHAVLQAIGEHKVAPNNYARMQKIGDGVVSELITNGHIYFGKKFPPMPAKMAFDGRDLALQWLKENSLPQDAKFEIVLAMNTNGNPCGLEDPACRWRAKIDGVCISYDEDEESSYRLVDIFDYKSSWPAADEELDSLQRRSQAVLGWLHHSDCDGIRLRVINLRTQKQYIRIIYFDEDGLELLRQWRKDILMQCDAADENTEARPGVGCETCPFANHCEEAQKIAAAADNAAALAIIENTRNRLKLNLRHQLQDSAGVTCGDGFVGYNLVKANIVTENGYDQILANWYNTSLDRVGIERGPEKGLLIALGIGPTNVKNFIKARFNGEHKTEKEEFSAFCLKAEYAAEFGIWKNGEATNGNGNGHAGEMKLLPENTMIVDALAKSKKTKRVRPVKATRPIKTKSTKKAKLKKALAKSKKKVVARKPEKKKKVVVRKGKSNRSKTTLKKPHKKRGRKVRK